jgi:hypothetical protein
MPLSTEILANREEFDSYTQIELKDVLPPNKYWLVWWYGGIRKNVKDNTQPLVKIVFREFFPNENRLSEEVYYRDICIAYLDQVQIGTICKNNMAIGCIKFERKTFKLNISEKSYDFISINDCCKNNVTLPFPSSLYKLSYKYDKNKLLRFELGNQDKLIIPSVDYFTKAYGSSELRRILATYMWDRGYDTARDRLLKPLKSQEEHNEIRVRIPHYLSVSDAPFLAYIKKFRSSLEKAKSIHAQLQSSYEQQNKYAFIQVAPWFTGEITIHVDGFSFGDSFLGLRVIKISDPKTGYKILQEIDEKGESKKGFNPEEDHSLRPSKILTAPPEKPVLTSTQSPDAGAPSLKITTYTEPLDGFKCEVKKVSSGVVVSSDAKNAKIPVELDEFSSGDPQGTDKDIGKVTLRSKPLVNSEGVLNDMWKAFNYVKNNYANLIDDVQWLKSDYFYCSDDNLTLIELPELDWTKIYDSSSIKNWLYMDDRFINRRGVLVIKVNMDNESFYVAEVQRKIKENNKNKIAKEEEIKGLAFRIDSGIPFDQGLHDVMKYIVLKAGNMDSVSSELKGNGIGFKHCESKDQTVTSESTCINVLKKMGYTVKLQKKMS